MNIDVFKLWRVPLLKDFLRKRGVKTTGNKEELVALVYACHVMMVPILSSAEDYRKDLSKEYASLLLVEGRRMPDPFADLQSGWEDEKNARKKWPPTMYGDMVEFMHECNVSSDCRKLLLSKYKTHKGFSYFDSQFLQEVFYHPVNNESGYCFLKAKVTPSQSINNDPHEAWVLIHKTTGRIESAYCSCMAGMFSQCNHVAAILFKVDWVWTSSDFSVTSAACQWNVPGEKGIQPCKIQDMAISKPRKRKGGQVRNINFVAKRLFCTNRSTKAKHFTLDDWAGIAYDKQETAVAFNYAQAHTVPAYNPDADVNVDVHVDVETSGNIPDPLPDVAQTFTSVNDFIEHLHTPLSSCDIEALEKSTRDQTSIAWAQQRHGRIGASNAHACKTMMASIQAGKPRNTDRLVKLLLGGGPDLNNIKAVKYGRDKEEEARQEYAKHHQSLHRHTVAVKSSGLAVHRQFPYISASPDGLLECECGLGLVEIKCPYTNRGKPPDASLDCLQEANGSLQLKKTHSYYTQCQQQLGVTGRGYCDFFVYCGKGMVFVERIVPDEKFMADSLRLVKEFFVRFVAPAMVCGGKRNSRCEETGGVQSRGCEMDGAQSKGCEDTGGVVISSRKDESGGCREKAVVISDESEGKALAPAHTRLSDEVPDQHPELTVTVSAPSHATGGRREVLLQVRVNVDQPTGLSPEKPVVRRTRVAKTTNRSKKGKPQYSCGSCGTICLEASEITCDVENSVGCDGCGLWYHYTCASFKPDDGMKDWYCSACDVNMYT